MKYYKTIDNEGNVTQIETCDYEKISYPVKVIEITEAEYVALSAAIGNAPQGDTNGG